MTTLAMTTPQDDLLPALREIEIHSRAALSWTGQRVEVSPAAGPLAGHPHHPLPADPLVRTLQTVLYERAYSRRLSRQSAPPSPEGPDPLFAARLSAPGAAAESWDPGWRIDEVGASGQISVRKGERQRFAQPGEFVSSGFPGLVPRSGDTVSLRVVCEVWGAQPGYFFRFGRTLSDVWDDSNLVRLYFHAAAAGAVDLVHGLGEILDRYRVPFRLKTLIDPRLYDRTDAAVLYIARSSLALAVRLLSRLKERLAAGLRPEVPLFTRFLRPGVGLAEEPNNGESFGMHRCRLAAEGIVTAWERGEISPEARLEAIRARFALDNLALEKPHLNPGSADFPELSAAEERSV